MIRFKLQNNEEFIYNDDISIDNFKGIIPLGVDTSKLYQLYIDMKDIDSENGDNVQVVNRSFMFGFTPFNKDPYPYEVITFGKPIFVGIVKKESNLMAMFANWKASFENE